MAEKLRERRQWLIGLCARGARVSPIPSDILFAVAMTESGGDPLAVRYERHYRWLTTLDGKPLEDGKLSDTETAGQKTSWGLLQVMGAVARERGFRGKFFTELCASPEVGLRYGALHLAAYLKRYGNEADAVAAYNAGSPVKEDDGSYRNQGYVDRVRKYLGRDFR